MTGLVELSPSPAGTDFTARESLSICARELQPLEVSTPSDVSYLQIRTIFSMYSKFILLESGGERLILLESGGERLILPETNQ